MSGGASISHFRYEAREIVKRYRAEGGGALYTLQHDFYELFGKQALKLLPNIYRQQEDLITFVAEVLYHTKRGSLESFIQSEIKYYVPPEKKVYKKYKYDGYGFDKGNQ